MTMFKRLTGFILCISMVIFSMTGAFAAPVRDARVMDVPADDSLRSLVSLYAGAALLRSVPALNEGEAPSEAYVEGVLLLGLSRIVLPRVDEDPLDDVETVPEDVLKTYYEELFASGVFQMPDAPSCPCITRNDDKLTFDLSMLEGDQEGGARIYAIKKDDNRLTVSADMFTAIGYAGEMVEDIPEDCLTWEAGMTLVLEKDGKSQFGYRLVSFSTTPAYLDGAVNAWQNLSAAGYSLTAPTFFSPNAVAQNGANTYTSADGTAVLYVEAISDSRTEKLDYYRSLYEQSHADASLLVEADLNYFTGETAGEYTLLIAPEDGAYVYRVTLTFPAERQAEFSFYGEIIRNSFGGDGLANG